MPALTLILASENLNSCVVVPGIIGNEIPIRVRKGPNQFYWSEKSIAQQ